MFEILLYVCKGDVMVKLIGIFSYGIKKHTSAHNHIFGILGGNVGDHLPPIALSWCLKQGWYLGSIWKKVPSHCSGSRNTINSPGNDVH